MYTAQRPQTNLYYISENAAVSCIMQPPGRFVLPSDKQENMAVYYTMQHQARAIFQSENK